MEGSGPVRTPSVQSTTHLDSLRGSAGVNGGTNGSEPGAASVDELLTGNEATVFPVPRATKRIYRRCGNVVLAAGTGPPRPGLDRVRHSRQKRRTASARAGHLRQSGVATLASPAANLGVARVVVGARPNGGRWRRHDHRTFTASADGPGPGGLGGHRVRRRGRRPDVRVDIARSLVLRPDHQLGGGGVPAARVRPDRRLRRHHPAGPGLAGTAPSEPFASWDAGAPGGRRDSACGPCPWPSPLPSSAGTSTATPARVRWWPTASARMPTAPASSVSRRSASCRARSGPTRRRPMGRRSSGSTGSSPTSRATRS